MARHSYYMKNKRQVSSRLAAKEQKKLSRQTFIMMAASIIIVLLFVFVILPLVVRIFFQFIDKGSPFEPSDTVPPQAPIIQSPINATNSAILPISGVAEAESTVVFVLNGSRLDEIEANNDGKFKYDLPLNEGENLLGLYSIDAAGNESIKTKNYNILYDSESPILEIEFPQDGQEITLRKNQVVEIKGKTESGAKVYINDRLSYPNALGEFKSRYSLSEGENILKFKAVDKGGNINEMEIKVNFKF